MPPQEKKTSHQVQKKTKGNILTNNEVFQWLNVALNKLIFMQKRF